MRSTAVLGVVLVLTGCGGTGEQRPLPAPRAAEPQGRELGWRESYPGPSGERIQFAVERFEVTNTGWKARIAVTNRTAVSFAARARGPSELRYGLMLFATGDLGELEQANERGALPAVRRATEIDPPPPASLAPGATWQATLSAHGTLPAGAYVRLVFGVLRPRGDPPEGMERLLIWITDRSYRLRP